MMLQLTAKAKRVSEIVDSHQCEAISAVAQSERILATARLPQPAGMQMLQKLLIKVKHMHQNHLLKRFQLSLTHQVQWISVHGASS